MGLSFPHRVLVFLEMFGMSTAYSTPTPKCFAIKLVGDESGASPTSSRLTPILPCHGHACCI